MEWGGRRERTEPENKSDFLFYKEDRCVFIFYLFFFTLRLLQSWDETQERRRATTTVSFMTS